MLVSKPILQQGIPEEYNLAGICAQSCLEGVCDKLQSGEVNIEDLQKVDTNREQMQRLCVAVSSNKDGRYSFKSVETAIKKRVEEYRAVKRRREVVSHLCRQILPIADNMQGISLQCSSLNLTLSLLLLNFASHAVCML
jgi:hypothetical protein